MIWIIIIIVVIVYILGVAMAAYQIKIANDNFGKDMIRKEGNMWLSWFGYPKLWSRIDTDENGNKTYIP